MSTITPEQEAAILDRVSGMTLSVGKGTKKSACSIAAINLALTGRLTDEIPACMSPVIGQWIIRIQDHMPSLVRNAADWKSLLPLAAGTGRDKELERLAIAIDWLFAACLDQVQPIADAEGFGPEWREMLEKRTPEAGDAAYSAAKAKANAYGDAADAAAYAAAYAAALAANSYSSNAVNAVNAVVYSAHSAYSAYSASRAARPNANSWSDFWAVANPSACLASMINA